MRIGILGADGFIGSKLLEVLSKNHTVTRIVRSNYDLLKGMTFDVFINANGSNNKYKAEQDPISDFETNVLSTYKSIYDFKFNKYIYLSSIAVYDNYVYGKNKKISEHILYNYHTKLNFEVVILRLGIVLGKEIPLGTISDILNNQELWVRKDSLYQFITRDAIVNFIERIININKTLDPMNLIGTKPIGIPDVERILNKKAIFGKRSKELKVYNYNVSEALKYYPLKTSEEYLKDYLKEL